MLKIVEQSTVWLGGCQLQLPTTTRNFQCASQASFPSACMCVCGVGVWCLACGLKSRRNNPRCSCTGIVLCGIGLWQVPIPMWLAITIAPARAMRHPASTAARRPGAGSRECRAGPAAARNSDVAWVHREVCASGVPYAGRKIGPPRS
jgi:hypothetical protein